MNSLVGLSQQLAAGLQLKGRVLAQLDIWVQEIVMAQSVALTCVVLQVSYMK